MPRDAPLQETTCQSATLWVCAAGKCPPITWTKTANGPDVPFCSCRVEAKRGGFYRYVDREPVEMVPRAVAERLTTALALLRGHVKDDEGWKLINDALWLGARDENDEPVHG